MFRGAIDLVQSTPLILLLLKLRALMESNSLKYYWKKSDANRDDMIVYYRHGCIAQMDRAATF
jgi:hypothetical protein